MGPRNWLKPPRQILVLFLGVAAVSFGALGTLAWRLLDQDRDLENQRRQLELESAADRLVATMQRSLADLQQHLASPGRALSELPSNVVAVTIAGDSVSSRPPGRLLYYPVVPSTPSPRTAFVEAERLEFSGDLNAAAAAYMRSARHADPAIRAGALMRLGRTLRKKEAVAPALGAYRDLDALDAVVVEDLPASLVAAQGRLDTYTEARRTDDAAREAAELLALLQEGRWQLTRPQYATYARSAREVLGSAPPDDPVAITRSEVVTELWLQRGTDHPITRELVSTPSGTALVIWTATATNLDAVIADQPYLGTLGDSVTDNMRWAISREGQPLVGTAPVRGLAAVRAAVTSGLPWTVHVFPASVEAPLPLPRRQIVWLLALVAAVLGGGWYFIFRSLARERQVARLQSDFVAAVSHEFRSPLTSLTHAADVLAGDRLSSDALRTQTYQVLVRDTARLRGLVEGLLAFGRLESGAPFQFEDTDVDALVRTTIDDFKSEPPAQGFDIDLDSDRGELGLTARVDREALARAVRNLLDNAVKYSPDARRIDVSVVRDGGIIEIAVRDRGIGIPAAEQRAIFEPFVRGTESTSRRIRGTGIGLAMVRQIARAHGGEVSVTSAPGEGSVFTIRLPAAPAVIGDATLGVGSAEVAR